MKGSVVDKILKARELKNEKNIAVARLIFITVVVILDYLSFLGVISYTKITPTLTTLILDTSFFVFSIIVLMILLRKFYYNSLKFFVITLDYLIIAMMLIFDPTVPKEGNWPGMVASIFLFLLNLIRYSKSGTIYSGILSVALLTASSLNQGNATDLFPMIVSLLMMLFIGYSITASNKKMMVEANTKKMMERYLPPQLVGELYRQNASLEPGGKNQEVTILFSDIRSFTSISESMPAEEVVTLLNGYLSIMTDIIFTNNGTIDKFIGDAIMTTFGAPIKNDDDAFRAIKTAISMIRGLKEFNKNQTQLKNPLKVGIGIHTGEVIVGNIGSDRRLDYTVIGDNVNLSSRIEGLTKYYKCPILISESTYNQLHGENMSDVFFLREVDHVVVKGKTTGIRIFEVMCFDDDDERQAKKTIKEEFEKGLKLYQGLRFQEAIGQFKKLPEDELSELYVRRCEHYIKNPPEASWNGTHVLETK
ncbi:MAG: adenylate/guanylate cyclase domain-containing protein [Brevinematales bacterium]|nr:adenylate/guanylate cyclase domain-containing protein [Brevinematales bacterium]